MPPHETPELPLKYAGQRRFVPLVVSPSIRSPQTQWVQRLTEFVPRIGSCPECFPNALNRLSKMRLDLTRCSHPLASSQDCGGIRNRLARNSKSHIADSLPLREYA